jgi:hypothetical protein
MVEALVEGFGGSVEGGMWWRDLVEGATYMSIGKITSFWLIHDTTRLLARPMHGPTQHLI